MCSLLGARAWIRINRRELRCRGTSQPHAECSRDELRDRRDLGAATLSHTVVDHTRAGWSTRRGSASIPPHHSIGRVELDRIAEGWFFFDREALWDQLGVEPPSR